MIDHDVFLAAAFRVAEQAASNPGRQQAALQELAMLVEELSGFDFATWDPKKHPRWPKGHPKGGKFMTKDEIAAAGGVEAIAKREGGKEPASAKATSKPASKPASKRGGKGDPAAVRQQIEALRGGKGDGQGLAEALAGLTVAQLKDLAREHKVGVSGAKAALVDRLAQAALAAAPAEKESFELNDYAKPEAKAKPSESAVWKGVQEAYSKLQRENIRTGGIVKIPELADEVAREVGDVSPDELHKMLQSWQKEGKLTLQLCNDPRLEPRASEGIQSPRGVLMYVYMRPEEPTTDEIQAKSSAQHAAEPANARPDVVQRVKDAVMSSQITDLAELRQQLGLPTEQFDAAVLALIDQGGAIPSMDRTAEQSAGGVQSGGQTINYLMPANQPAKPAAAPRSQPMPVKKQPLKTSQKPAAKPASRLQ